MLISELEKIIQKIKAEHNDIEVGIPLDGNVCCTIDISLFKDINDKKDKGVIVFSPIRNTVMKTTYTYATLCNNRTPKFKIHETLGLAVSAIKYKMVDNDHVELKRSKNPGIDPWEDVPIPKIKAKDVSVGYFKRLEYSVG